MKLWDLALKEIPLIAILRGLHPEQAIDVADILVGAGFRIIEVPLNSPDPLTSIARIADKYGDQVIVGAGTVLKPEEVTAVTSVGGQIVISPNMNPSVGAQSIALGAKWCPGVATPTEAFAAMELGAAMLKFFPAEMIPPKAIAAMRAVLPKHAIVAAVGGITPQVMADYYKVGVDSFGLGSVLYKPEYDRTELIRRSTAFVKEYKEISSQ